MIVRKIVCHLLDPIRLGDELMLPTGTLLLLAASHSDR